MDGLAVASGVIGGSSGPVTARHRPKRDELARWVNSILPEESTLKMMPATLASDIADGHLLGLLLMQWGLMKRGEFKKFRKGRSNDIALHNYRMLEPIFRILRLQVSPTMAAKLIKGNQQASIDLLVELKYMFEGRPARGPVFNQDFVVHKRREAGTDGSAHVGDVKSLDWMMELQQRVPPRQQEALHDRLHRTLDEKRTRVSAPELPGVYDHLPANQREKRRQRDTVADDNSRPLSALAQEYAEKDRREARVAPFHSLHAVKPAMPARRGRPTSAGPQRNAFIELMVDGFPTNPESKLTVADRDYLRRHFQNEHPDAGTAFRSPRLPEYLRRGKEGEDEDEEGNMRSVSEPLLLAPMTQRATQYTKLNDALLTLMPHNQVPASQDLGQGRGQGRGQDLGQPIAQQAAVVVPRVQPKATCHVSAESDTDWLQRLAEHDQRKWDHGNVPDEPNDCGEPTGSVLNLDPEKLRQKLGVSVTSDVLPKRATKSFEEQKQDRARIEQQLKKHRERMKRILKGKEKLAAGAEAELANYKEWMTELEEHDKKQEEEQREEEDGATPTQADIAQDSNKNTCSVGHLKRDILGDGPEYFSVTEKKFVNQGLLQGQLRESGLQSHKEQMNRRTMTADFEKQHPHVQPHLLRQDHRLTRSPLSLQQLEEVAKSSVTDKASILDRPTLKCDQLQIALQQYAHDMKESSVTEPLPDNSHIQQTLQNRMQEMRFDEEKRMKTRKMLRPHRRTMPQFMQDDPDNIAKDTEEWSEAQHACIQEKLNMKRIDKAESIRHRRFYVDGLHKLVQQSQREALQEDVSRCRLAHKCAAEERVENRLEEMSQEIVHSILASSAARANFRDCSHVDILGEKQARLERELNRDKEDFQNRVAGAVQLVESYRRDLVDKEHEATVDFCYTVCREMIDFAIKHRQMKETMLEDEAELSKTALKLLFMFGQPLFANSPAGPNYWRQVRKPEEHAGEGAIARLLNTVDRKHYLSYENEWTYVPPPGMDIDLENDLCTHRVMHFSTDSPGNFLMTHLLKACEDWLQGTGKSKSKQKSLPSHVALPRHRIRGVLIGKPFAGKTALLKRLRENYPLKIITEQYLTDMAVQAFEAQKAEFAATMSKLKRKSETFWHERASRGPAPPSTDTYPAPLEQAQEPVKSSASIATKSSKSVKLQKTSRPASVATPVHMAPPPPTQPAAVSRSQVCPINGSIHLPHNPKIEVVDPDFSGEWLKFSAMAVIGQNILEHLAVGWRVPDKLLMELLGVELQKLDKKMGWIIDGFPNTLKQAQMLVYLLAGYPTGELQEGDAFGSQMAFSPLDTNKPMIRVLSQLLPNILTGEKASKLNSGLDFVIDLETSDDRCCRRAIGNYYRNYIRDSEGMMKEKFRSLLSESRLPLGNMDLKTIVYLHDQMRHHARHSANVVRFYDTFGIIHKFDGDRSIDDNFARFKCLLNQLVGDSIKQILKEAKEEEEEKKRAVLVAKRKALEEAQKAAEAATASAASPAPESPPKTPAAGARATPKAGKGKAGAKGAAKPPAKGAAKGVGKAAAKGAKVPPGTDTKPGQPSSREPSPQPQPNPFKENYAFCTTKTPDKRLITVLVNFWREMETKYFRVIDSAFTQIRSERERMAQSVFAAKAQLFQRLQLTEGEDAEMLDLFAVQTVLHDLMQRSKHGCLPKSEAHYAVQALEEDLLVKCDATAKFNLNAIRDWQRFAFAEDHTGFLSNIFISLMQAELMRYHVTCRIIFDYYNMLEGGRATKNNDKLSFLKFLKVPRVKLAVELVIGETPAPPTGGEAEEESASGDNSVAAADASVADANHAMQAPGKSTGTISVPTLPPVLETSEESTPRPAPGPGGQGKSGNDAAGSGQPGGTATAGTAGAATAGGSGGTGGSGNNGGSDGSGGSGIDGSGNTVGVSGSGGGGGNGPSDGSGGSGPEAANILPYIEQTGPYYESSAAPDRATEGKVGEGESSAAPAADSSNNDSSSSDSSNSDSGFHPHGDSLVCSVRKDAEDQVDTIYKCLEEKYTAPVRPNRVSSDEEKKAAAAAAAAAGKKDKGAKKGKTTPAKGRKGAESAVAESATAAGGGDPDGTEVKRIGRIRKEAMAAMDMERERCLERLSTIQRNASTLINEHKQTTQGVYTEVRDLVQQKQDAKRTSVAAAIRLLRHTAEKQEPYLRKMEIVNTELHVDPSLVTFEAHYVEEEMEFCEHTVAGLPLTHNLELFGREMKRCQGDQALLTSDVMDSLERAVNWTLLPGAATGVDYDWRRRALVFLFGSNHPPPRAALVDLANTLASADTAKSRFLSHTDFTTQVVKWLVSQASDIARNSISDKQRYVRISECLFNCFETNGRLPYCSALFFLCAATTPLLAFLNMLSVLLGTELDMSDTGTEVPLNTVNEVLSDKLLGLYREGNALLQLTQDDFNPELREKAKKLRKLPKEILKSHLEYEEQKEKNKSAKKLADTVSTTLPLADVLAHSVAVSTTLPLADVLAHSVVTDFVHTCPVLRWLPSQPFGRCR